MRHRAFLPHFWSAVLAAAVLGAGCAVDPEQLADSSVAGGAAYRHGGGERPLLPAGRWWERFADPGLTELIDRLDSANPTLAVALARYDRARAELGIVRADLRPAVDGDLVWKRKRDSASGVFVPPEVNYSEYRAALNLSYEIDLWGRVRRSVEAARAESEAAGADWAAARLSLRAELARNYFQLRYIDSELELLRRAASLRHENLDLVRARLEGGEATDLDLARAETELESARAQVLQLERSRTEFLHALAALCGEAPAHFSLPGGSLRPPPPVPAGVPSELLLRRPDIAAAERRMQSAAAQIGVVKASFLPRVSLGASGGVSSLDLGVLFSPSSLFGEIGPSLSVPLYRGGRARSEVGRAFAESDEAVALYRETVAGAFREVEDALSATRLLEREIAAHQKAADSARRAASLSRNRYEEGFVSYLEVVDAERSALAEQRNAVQARAARLLASVQLVQALGGGWEAPAPEAASRAR